MSAIAGPYRDQSANFGGCLKGDFLSWPEKPLIPPGPVIVKKTRRNHLNQL